MEILHSEKPENDNQNVDKRYVLCDNYSMTILRQEKQENEMQHIGEMWILGIKEGIYEVECFELEILSVEKNSQVNLMINNINNKSLNFQKIFNSDYTKIFPIIGLKNIGKISSLNSILQCLLHIPELNSYFIIQYQKDKNNLYNINKDFETEGLISKEYYNICNYFYNKKNNLNKDNYFTPQSFSKMLSYINEQFSINESSDVKELLLYLMQNMHKELNYSGDKKLKSILRCNFLIENEAYNYFKESYLTLNSSIFSKSFSGQIKSYQLCQNCNSKYYCFENFLCLTFPLNNFKNANFNLYKGFKEYTSEKIININCQVCKKVCNAKKASSIFYSPLYLIIFLDYGKEKKNKPIKTRVGERINISGFADINNKELEYELVSVISFIENYDNYICFCKYKDNQWYSFNNTIYKICDFKESLTNNPYILIWKKGKF